MNSSCRKEMSWICQSLLTGSCCEEAAWPCLNRLEFKLQQEMHKYFSGHTLKITWVIFFLGYSEISAFTRRENGDRWSVGDANSLSPFCQTGSLFKRSAARGWTHFPVGSPVSAVEHISVTCGCSIPGAGACLMDSGGSCRHQTPELEPIRQRASDVSTPASLRKMFLLVSSPVAPTECACQL